MKPGVSDTRNKEEEIAFIKSESSSGSREFTGVRKLPAGECCWYCDQPIFGRTPLAFVTATCGHQLHLKCYDVLKDLKKFLNKCGQCNTTYVFEPKPEEVIVIQDSDDEDPFFTDDKNPFAKKY